MRFYAQAEITFERLDADGVGAAQRISLAGPPSAAPSRRLPLWPITTQAMAPVFLSVAVPIVLLVLQMILERMTGGK